MWPSSVHEKTRSEGFERVQVDSVGAVSAHGSPAHVVTSGSLPRGTYEKLTGTRVIGCSIEEGVRYPVPSGVATGILQKRTEWRLCAPGRRASIGAAARHPDVAITMAAMPTSAARKSNELRPIRIKRRFTRTSPGSVLIRFGGTSVLCTASVAESVPPWLEGRGRGWITAEYSMMPHSTTPRRGRDRGPKVDGRTTEIQRLVGRSLRAVADLEALGERTVTVDCDVMEADGGTRTASITGAFIAVVDAIASVKRSLPDPKRYPLRDSVAAVSVGMVGGRAVLDLDYEQDVGADVDMNVVMTGGGRFVEIQGTGEEATFGDDDLAALLGLAKRGIRRLTGHQRDALGARWPL
jgi:ribonuclease PH